MIEMQTGELTTVLSTPWFKLMAKKVDNTPEPYYFVQSTDAVSVIAMTPEKKVILVQQYRPAIDSESLELPAGHLKDMETPEDAARRELLEETGYLADKVEFLGVLYPNTTRIGHKLWCYFAPNVIKAKEPELREINKVINCYQSELVEFIKAGKIKQALDIAAVFLGIQNNKLA